MPSLLFEATSPAFVRHLSQSYGTRELIVTLEERLTYAQADARSAHLAKGMLGSGISKGTRLGVLLPNGAPFLLTWLAATRIGALVIPISTFSKPRELERVLRHADVEVLITSARLLANDYLTRLEDSAPSLEGADGKRPLYLPELPYLRRIYVFGPSDRAWSRSFAELDAAEQVAIDDNFLAAVERSVTPADAMTIIYSSGSTAAPKGALHTHASVIRHAFDLSLVREIETEDRCYSPMPFFWVGGLIFTLHCVMHRGACLVTEPFFDPVQTLHLLERERVTHVSGWPHYGKALVEHPSFKERNLSALRAGNIYAILPEAVRPKDVELRSNGLGMTETCGPHSLARVDVDLPERLRGSFGSAVGDVERKIVDPETGLELPRGMVGELCVRGHCVMRELYKVERHQTFDADGFYHTGDACYLNDEGHLFFSARIGDMIKTAGANVAPREIEVSLETQAEIQMAIVVGVPHPHRGQDVAAVIVLKDGYALDEQRVVARLRRELSSYKVPQSVYFMRPTDVPLTSSGKVDRRSLVARLSAGLGERQGRPVASQ